MTGIRATWGRFCRFNLVGALGAGLQLELFAVVPRVLHWPLEGAALLSVELAVLHNFVWHARFTWRDRGTVNLGQWVKRLWRFHLGNGMVSLIGNAALIHLLAGYLHVPAMLAAVAAIAACAPVNFWLADRWVYLRALPATGSPGGTA